MKSRFFIAACLLIAAAFCSIVYAQDPTFAEKLSVDFTNAESRSISVKLGQADGITSDMNFAVLDSAGVQVTEFYPHEILTDRFWSGPLLKSEYTRVSAGDRIVQITLSKELASRLRSDFAARLVALKAERKQKRIEKLKEDIVYLKDEINDLDVDDVGLKSEVGSLQKRLKREKGDVKRDVDDVQEQVAALRDDRAELMEERDDLLDRRESLKRRSNPPQDDISDLNEDIADLDRDISQLNTEMEDLREEIRELRETTRDLEEDVREIRAERNELNAERKELQKELGELEKELGQLQKKKP
jgi:predicted  nucleic acid-binding Zn-ribbon protein